MIGATFQMPNQPSGGGGGGSAGTTKKKKKGGGGGGGGNNNFSFSLKDLFNVGMDLNHPVQQTRRDMKLLYGPQIRGLKHDYGQYANQMGALYDILGRELGSTAAPAQENYQKINDAYTSGTQGIIDSLGQTTAPDQAAFLNTLGAQALAGSRDLATSATNEQRYNDSMLNQADLESMILQRNARGDLQDALDELRKQRATDFRSTLDQNREAAFQRMLALNQLHSQGQSDKWARQMWADYFGGAMGGGGHGGGGGGGGGGGDGRGGAPQQTGGQAGGGFDPQKIIRNLLGEGTFQDLTAQQRKKSKRYVKGKSDEIAAILNGLVPGDPFGIQPGTIGPALRNLGQLDLGGATKDVMGAFSSLFGNGGGGGDIGQLDPKVIRQIMDAIGGVWGNG